jgi:1-acyl-sn-glycerol-3-phosphate acyltransferase
MNWQQLGPDVPTGGNWLTMRVGRAAMRLLGWRLEGEFPNEPKVIVAVAPHTSNIDFLLTIMVIWGLGLKASYLAKQSLFRFPLGLVMTHFGGIPVDRDASQGLVEQLTARFASQSQLILGITPEGTRGAVKHWKRGFALIAQAAAVPVVPAIVNYETRTVRFHDPVRDVGNAEKTLLTVQAAAATGAPRRRDAGDD